MNGEILSIETVKRQAKAKQVIEYMKQNKKLIAIMGTSYYIILDILQDIVQGEK